MSAPTLAPGRGREVLQRLADARLPRAWFEREVDAVARDLVGCALVHRGRAGVIVETEAYGGPEDRASHARFGPTPRTQVMFERGGVAYVYLCYGVHEMFNVVTGPAGAAQAVLVRAIAPHVGLPADPAIGRGPGKVTAALGLDRRHDRRELGRGALFIAPAHTPPALAIGPRIGVAYAGAWAEVPRRFWWAEHPSVSAQRPPPRRRQVAAGVDDERSVSTRRSR